MLWDPVTIWIPTKNQDYPEFHDLKYLLDESQYSYQSLLWDKLSCGPKISISESRTLIERVAEDIIEDPVDALVQTVSPLNKNDTVNSFHLKCLQYEPEALVGLWKKSSKTNYLGVHKAGIDVIGLNTKTGAKLVNGEWIKYTDS